MEAYQEKVSRSQACGGTEFSAAFDKCIQYIEGKPDIRDVSIIFFTDGLDGDKSRSDRSLESLKTMMGERYITSRFLTIGFSQYHDANFLGSIARSGSELGNFFFIDTSRPDKQEKIKECLVRSLSMAREEHQSSNFPDIS